MTFAFLQRHGSAMNTRLHRPLPLEGRAGVGVLQLPKTRCAWKGLHPLSLPSMGRQANEPGHRNFGETTESP